MRGRLLLALALTLGVAWPADAADGPAPASDGPLARLVDVRDPGEVSPRAHLAAERVRTLADVAANARAFLDAALPHGALAVGPWLEPADDTGLRSIVAPIGEIDGDGVGDAIVLDYAPATDEVWLTAVRGADLAPVWRRDAAVSGAAFIYGGVDVTDDGRADLVFLEGRVDPDAPPSAAVCPLVGCTVVVPGFLWDLTLVSGADGSTVWTRRYEASFTHVDLFVPADPFARVFAWRETATNLYVVPFLSDGRLAVTTIDADSTYLFERNFLTGTGRAVDWTYDARFEIFAGSAPEPAATLRVEGTASPALAVPMGDFVGTPRGDLVVTAVHEPDPQRVCGPLIAWCESGRFVFDFLALDGETLAPVWRAGVPSDDAEIATMQADVDDDGRADLVVIDHEGPPGTMTFLSGATGAPLWSHEASSALDVGSLDGGAGSDVVMMRRHPWGLGFHLDHLDGATGALLRTLDLTMDPGSARAAYRALGGFRDLDGDGFHEVFTDRTWQGHDGVWRDLREIRSGADGRLLASRVPAGEILAPYYGDVPAGAPAYYVVTPDRRLDAYAGLGTPVWSRPLAYAEGSAPLARTHVVSDMTGDGIEDAFFQTFDFFEWRYRADLVRGTDGATAWSFDGGP